MYCVRWKNDPAEQSHIKLITTADAHAIRIGMKLLNCFSTYFNYILQILKSCLHQKFNHHSVTLIVV